MYQGEKTTTITTCNGIRIRDEIKKKDTEETQFQVGEIYILSYTAILHTCDLLHSYMVSVP